MSEMNLFDPNLISNSLPVELQEEITRFLNKSGMYYRAFTRTKSQQSIIEKMGRKKYAVGGPLMQDLVGVRIVLYFKDDINICRRIVERSFKVVDVSESIPADNHFDAERLNFVCKIPEHLLFHIDESIWKYPIDKTFEVQIRTIFSEGWHEVEHDIRYKSETDWEKYKELSRSLNGLLATLETCDWAMISLIENLAYRQYKDKKWSEMLKYRFRIHIIDNKLNPELEAVFNSNPDLSKQFFRLNRDSVLISLVYRTKSIIPITVDNLVYLINYWYIQSPLIEQYTPKQINDLIIALD